MKKIFTLIALMTLATSVSARAVFYKEIKCHTNRMAKGIKVTEEGVNFFEKSFSRELASVATREKSMTEGSVTRSFQFEGHKYTIHVEDVDNFSEMDDYLTISDSKGHEILYPVICSKS